MKKYLGIRPGANAPGLFLSLVDFALVFPYSLSRSKQRGTTMYFDFPTYRSRWRWWLTLLPNWLNSNWPAAVFDEIFDGPIVNRFWERIVYPIKYFTNAISSIWYLPPNAAWLILQVLLVTVFSAYGLVAFVAVALWGFFEAGVKIILWFLCIPVLFLALLLDIRFGPRTTTD